MFKISTELQKELHKIKLSSQQKGFADLVLLGYKPKDAFLICGLYDEAISEYKNNEQMNKLINSNPSFANYMSAKSEEMKRKAQAEAPKNIEDLNLDDDGLLLQDKEAAIRELESIIPELSGKDKADVIMRISDLRGWKKEQTKEEVDLVKYFLPPGCYNCSLYIKAKKEHR